VTFNETVFEVSLPFFGVTVMVTLQVPTLRPLRDEPETLQNFAELATTFNDNLDVETTVSLAYEAIDLTVADLDIVNLGATTVGVTTVGVVTVGVVTVGVFTVLEPARYTASV
jgi:hypothetical protein